MNDILKRAVGASHVENLGEVQGGQISEAYSYQTDKGKFFIKVNGNDKAREMFVGEKASLEALLSTKTVRCPQPVALVDNPDGSGMTFIVEHLELEELGPEQWTTLGEQVAHLHLYNSELRAKETKNINRIGHSSCDDDMTSGKFVEQFGFHITTCCGFIPLDNTWNSDWMAFFVRQRLKPQLDRLERDFCDRDVIDLWPLVERNIPKLFEDIEILPSLLHGDLNKGNVGQAESQPGRRESVLHGDLNKGNVGQADSQPVVFDPNCFYGHSEFELVLNQMFGGFEFSPNFYNAYHKIIPRAPGYQERYELYKLFNEVNHWNHFGADRFKIPTLRTMKKLAGMR